MQGMLGRLPLSEFQGPRDELEKRLAGPDCERWLTEFKRFVRKEPCWVKDPVFRLFRLVTTIPVPAIERFVVRDNFVVDTSDRARVKIGHLSNNFKKCFLCNEEWLSEATELKVWELPESWKDKLIIDSLGGNAEITLGQLFSVLAKQPGGEKGHLLVDGWANSAYIRSGGNILQSVSARWIKDYSGWEMDVDSVSPPLGLCVSRRILSR